MTIIATVRDYVTLQDTAFDEALLIHINTALYFLYQLGIIESIVVTPESDWGDLVLTIQDTAILEVVKNNVSTRVKFLFDGDKHTVVLQEILDESDNRLLLEIEFRREDAALP